MKRPALEAWLTARIAKALDRSPRDIARDEAFTDLGLDSLETAQITRELEEMLDQRLNPTLLWDHRSIRALAAFLSHPDDGSR